MSTSKSRAIADIDKKRLWGNAAGRCSNPNCRTRLSDLSEHGKGCLFGEMAHIVAYSMEGPRSEKFSGTNSYDNLILLCPTCHTQIDRSPELYSVELLKDWKRQHEDWIERSCAGQSLKSIDDLMRAIDKILTENNYYFKSYGPKSLLANQYPSSSAYNIWIERRFDTIIPNNKKIISLLDENKELIPASLHHVVILLKDHVAAYEQNAYNRLDYYPLFPDSFALAVSQYLKYE